MWRQSDGLPVAYQDKWLAIDRDPDNPSGESDYFVYQFYGIVKISSFGVKNIVAKTGSAGALSVSSSLDGKNWTSLGTVGNNATTTLAQVSMRVMCSSLVQSHRGTYSVLGSWRLTAYRCPMLLSSYYLGSELLTTSPLVLNQWYWTGIGSSINYYVGQLPATDAKIPLIGCVIDFEHERCAWLLARIVRAVTMRICLLLRRALVGIWGSYGD